jgi:phosphoribosyl 1,2-cyclic phosphodiesterase
VRATIWGCRGSVATPGPDTTRYGGNTACVEVRLDDGTVVILDAGTGLRALGLKLQAEEVSEVHLLLSHFHLDHLIGLGFFSLLRVDGATIHLWGPSCPGQCVGTVIGRYLSPPLFPVRLSEAVSRVQLHEVPSSGRWRLGSAWVAADFVTHRGPTVGYRIEDGGRSLAYLPDHEPGLHTDLCTAQPSGISGFAIARGADVLLHDAQYTAEEYARRAGWGHSSLEQAVQFAQRAEVGRLIPFHHDPEHSDADLDAMESECRSLWGRPGDAPAFAQEGMQLPLAVPTSPSRPVATPIPAGCSPLRADWSQDASCRSSSTLPRCRGSQSIVRGRATLPPSRLRAELGRPRSRPWARCSEGRA